MTVLHVLMVLKWLMEDAKNSVEMAGTLEKFLVMMVTEKMEMGNVIK